MEKKPFFFLERGHKQKKEKGAKNTSFPFPVSEGRNFCIPPDRDFELDEMKLSMKMKDRASLGVILIYL